MNGYVSEIIETKGFAYIQTYICAEDDQIRICSNNTFDTQQRDGKGAQDRLKMLPE